jgi:hypothetical protein
MIVGKWAIATVLAFSLAATAGLSARVGVLACGAGCDDQYGYGLQIGPNFDGGSCDSNPNGPRFFTCFKVRCDRNIFGDHGQVTDTCVTTNPIREGHFCRVMNFGFNCNCP